MKKNAVIVAAGSGTRMGNSIPKQFLDLAGRPVFIHSVDAFLAAYPDFFIILVAPDHYLDQARQIIEAHGYSSQTLVIAGGSTRSKSVRNGLEHVDEGTIVLVHDAARCAVTPDLIINCVAQAISLGSAVPVIAVTDSVRRITDTGSEPLHRNDLRLVQTPQAFQSKLLKDAYKMAAGRDFTDDASVVEHSGVPIHLIEGEVTNIKLTTALDLEVVRLIKKA